MWTKGWLVAVVVFQLTSGCSSDGADAKKVPVGQSCSSEAECSGGFCLENACSKHCTSDRDCATEDEAFGFVCGVDPEGESSCVPRCDRSSVYVCVDDVSTSCDVAPSDQCEECGCSGAQRCEPGVGCMPKRAQGEPCTRDDDCNTDNCSDFAGVCRVPLGSVCDATNCDACLSGTDFSYCSRECSSKLDCGGALCLGYDDIFYCHPPCAGFGDDACPGNACKVFIDDLTNAQSYYCDCVNASEGCRWLEAPHPLGASCRYNEDCESQLCDRVVTGTGVLGGYNYSGVCSLPCATSDECGMGFACSAIGDPHCLRVCEEQCSDGGSCVALPSVEGATTSVCWQKRAEGQCWEASDCQSGKCAGNVCAPASGQPNGGPCDTNTDCASGSCVGANCRGTALAGDACEAAADCAVGTCCPAGANANTCATDCE